jgi:hypothetical protein
MPLIYVVIRGLCRELVKNINGRTSFNDSSDYQVFMERLTKYLWDLFTSFEVRMRLFHVTEVISENLLIK